MEAVNDDRFEPLRILWIRNDGPRDGRIQVLNQADGLSPRGISIGPWIEGAHTNRDGRNPR